jgi:hypothetical protein
MDRIIFDGIQSTGRHEGLLRSCPTAYESEKKPLKRAENNGEHVCTRLIYFYTVQENSEG